MVIWEGLPILLLELRDISSFFFWPDCGENERLSFGRKYTKLH